MEIAWIHSKALKVDSFVSDFVSDQFCTILNGIILPHYPS